MMLALSGSANAGYWEFAYDLSDSIVTTISGAGSLTDPMTGQFRFQFDSLSEPAPAPYGGARMVAGKQFVELNQVATLITLTLTGTTFDGQAFSASDCVQLSQRRRGHGRNHGRQDGRRHDRRDSGRRDHDD